MSRYTGPRLRIARRLQTTLSGLTRKSTERRPYPPGQYHRRRLRISDYSIHLQEKQKLRYYYGLTEVQLRNYVRRTQRMQGGPAQNLAKVLELRLDNVVFRLGFAPTIPAARQMIRHGHISVRGRKVSMPAFSVKVGDRIEVREKYRANLFVADSVKRGPQLSTPSYMERDSDGWGGRIKDTPVREDMPVEFDDRLVAEFYATK